MNTVTVPADSFAVIVRQLAEMRAGLDVLDGLLHNDENMERRTEHMRIWVHCMKSQCDRAVQYEADND